jgi:tetratricopeptide (TPR) repeat protein
LEKGQRVLDRSDTGLSGLSEAASSMGQASPDLLTRVRQMTERGEHPEVIELLEHEASRLSDDASLQTALGWAAENLEPPDLPAARAAYERALQLDPHVLEARGGLANVLFTLGEKDASTDLYRDVIVRVDDASLDLRALELKGWALLKMDEPEPAVQVFSSALKIEPGAVAIRFDLGLALLAAGEVSKAVDAYGNALRDLREVPQPRRVGALIVAIADLDAGIEELAAIRENYAAREVRSRLAWELSEAKRARDADGAL